VMLVALRQYRSQPGVSEHSQPEFLDMHGVEDMLVESSLRGADVGFLTILLHANVKPPLGVNRICWTVFCG